MKTAAVLIVSVLASAVPGVWGQLVNGSFEEPETVLPNPYSDLAVNWGRWGNWMNRETAWVPARSGQCLIGYHHWKIMEPATSGIYQDITNIPPGSSCSFGVFVYKDPETDAELVTLRLEKIGGFQVLASRVYSMRDLRSSWQRLSVEGTNDTPGLRVLIEIKPKESPVRSGAIKFDDAELKVVSPVIE